ncbi:nucleoside hydrolase [soil metagenome]
MARKLILDVDTGTDDAVAIMLAALHPDLELVACTTVNGNAEVSYCTDNTLRVLDHIGRPDIPVYEGLHRPIVREDFPVPRGKDDAATKIHGKTLPLPATSRAKSNIGAVEFLIETYRAATDEITLVPVAPLSNIAAALALDSKFAERVPHVVIMGGGHETGNVTPSAEFNMWCDPEAAAAVLSAPFRTVTLVTLDATHRALISRADCAALKTLATPAGEATAGIIERRIGIQDELQKLDLAESAPVHDAVCVASLIDPGIISTRRLHVAVETTGALTVGRTVIDTRGRRGKTPNCDVAFDADARRFAALLLHAFRRPN